jgi:hypothetical protein
MSEGVGIPFHDGARFVHLVGGSEASYAERREGQNIAD